MNEEQQAFDRFLAWEQTTRDTIDFKKVYVDMAGDLIAGLLLSQIVYWHLPDAQGRPTKMRARHDGELWIAKGRDDWWDEIRITARQFDRAIKILEKRGLVVTSLYKWNGAPTKHVRIEPATFLEAWESVFTQTSKSILPDRQNPFYAKGEKDFDETGKSLTETTSESTPETSSENNNQQQAVVAALLEYGMGGAAQKVNDYGAERCAEVLAYARRHKLGPGWIVAQLKSDEPLPAEELPEKDRRQRFAGGEYADYIQS